MMFPTLTPTLDPHPGPSTPTLLAYHALLVLLARVGVGPSKWGSGGHRGWGSDFQKWLIYAAPTDRVGMVGVKQKKYLSGEISTRKGAIMQKEKFLPSIPTLHTLHAYNAYPRRRGWFELWSTRRSKG